MDVGADTDAEENLAEENLIQENLIQENLTGENLIQENLIQVQTAADKLIVTIKSFLCTNSSWIIFAAAVSLNKDVFRGLFKLLFFAMHHFEHHFEHRFEHCHEICFYLIPYSAAFRSAPVRFCLWQSDRLPYSPTVE